MPRTVAMCHDSLNSVELAKRYVRWNTHHRPWSIRQYQQNLALIFTVVAVVGIQHWILHDHLSSIAVYAYVIQFSHLSSTSIPLSSFLSNQMQQQQPNVISTPHCHSCCSMGPSPYRRSLLSRGLATAVSSSASFTTNAGNDNVTMETVPIAPITTSVNSYDIPKEWQGEVLAKLRTIIDPDLGSDIVTLGFVQNLVLDTTTTMNQVAVSFNVELTTPACPVKDQFATDCKRMVLQLPWVDDVHVNMTSRTMSSTDVSSSTMSGMSQVGAIIAVSSCKGGVGKSTTAVNLAYALQGLGATVGIFDADVYGPSLPTMVKPDNDIVQFVGRQIAPLQRNGVRLMSFGYVSDDAAIMRGPMVSQLLDQIISVTHWGPIDYMILDMPPGTGDIALTLTQRLNITAAVIVTTPQELSFTDVVRGINMFDSVAVPCIAVVENMAYYEIEKPSSTNVVSTSTTESIDTNQLKVSLCNRLKEVRELQSNTLVGDTSAVKGTSIDKLADELIDLVVQQLQKQHNDTGTDFITNSNMTSERVPIFGMGHAKRLSQQFGIDHTFSVPLVPTIAANGDAGTPYILEHPNTPQSNIFKQLASAVVTEVAKIQYAGTSQRPVFEYEKDDHVIVMRNDGSQGLSSSTTRTIVPAALRRACRCAACVEELTGRQILEPRSIAETISPRKMYPTGNYALSVDWSDGHRSLYPYRLIRSILQDQTQQATNDSTP
jgi:Mrp family chromosome partitioning ATPase/DUF971 family protein